MSQSPVSLSVIVRFLIFSSLFLVLSNLRLSTHFQSERTEVRDVPWFEGLVTHTPGSDHRSIRRLNRLRGRQSTGSVSVEFTGVVFERVLQREAKWSRERETSLLHRKISLLPSPVSTLTTLIRRYEVK